MKENKRLIKESKATRDIVFEFFLGGKIEKLNENNVNFLFKCEPKKELITYK